MLTCCKSDLLTNNFQIPTNITSAKLELELISRLELQLLIIYLFRYVGVRNYIITTKHSSIRFTYILE